jgi:hypothetical protein
MATAMAPRGAATRRQIVRWNRETNVVEPLYDMFDFADPRKDMCVGRSRSSRPPSAGCRSDGGYSERFDDIFLVV